MCSLCRGHPVILSVQQVTRSYFTWLYVLLHVPVSKAASVCMAVSRRVWLHVCLFNYVVSAYMSISSTVDVWRLSTCLLPYLYPLSPVVGYIVKHMGSENTVQEDREKKHTPLLHTKSSWTYTTYVRPHFSARFWKSGHASGAVHSLHSLPYQKRMFRQDDIEMALRVFIENIMDWHYLQTVQLSLYKKKKCQPSPHDVNVF